MDKISLNQGWKFKKSTQEETTDVTLPHDAMILEERTPTTKNGSTSGFYPGGTYTYTKELLAPEEWQDKVILLEFEGVYAHAFVYINNVFAEHRPYGYSNFYVDCTDLLKFGETNTITVVAKTGMEQTSRWYTGSGIYRDVWLYVGDTAHIPVNGIKITTPDIERELATVMLDLTVKNAQRGTRNLRITTEILNEKGQVVAQNEAPLTAFSNETYQTRLRLSVENPQLWSCETPYLYSCKVTLYDDEEAIDKTIESFGIRKLQLDTKYGLRINGEQVKLRGACIHHDNGVIGAVTLAKAEERRIAQLKQAGFNSVRSSHHPMSKTMLDVCDRLGMLVMDEAFDVWTWGKSAHDYSLYFPDWWERDIEAMVYKNQNHPCVIMYSIGNEIGETGNPKGAEINRNLANKIRSLDDTRYITNGINGMNSNMEVMDKIINDISGGRLTLESKGDDEGSNKLNGWLTMMTGGLYEKFMAHPLVGQRTEESFAELDVAGLNYLSEQYEAHHKLYPNRIMIGAETFPPDIAELWDLVTKHDYVIGDMTWTGYDYLGEAGCGIHYYDGKENFTSNWPDRLAYVGDIDITGYRRPLSYLRECVFGLRKDPYIAVERVNYYGMPHSTTPWIGKDDIASWTWPGYEGKPAKINVSSPSEEVELFLNGESLGRKPVGKPNGYTASFEITYQPGELLAVGYSKGKEDGRMSLQTAGDTTILDIQADTQTLKADGADLAYITIQLVDSEGVLNLWESKEVSVEIQGEITLQGFGSGNPQSEGNYFDTVWPTYDGRVMAVVRSGFKKGNGKVIFSAADCKPVAVEIKIV
ncbi:MAG TPA: glycoside hydrolase family 2 TIM barrel-domain containing protein [Clostridia bacterium]|nr:glycoside hydrolase family 2 TIM barrel-domain containing protein [Clostridia bacterium]